MRGKADQDYEEEDEDGAKEQGTTSPRPSPPEAEREFLDSPISITRRRTRARTIQRAGTVDKHGISSRRKQRKRRTWRKTTKGHRPEIVLNIVCSKSPITDLTMALSL
jgi:hypothetical protein